MRTGVIASICILMAVYVGWTLVFPTIHVRYRLTLEVADGSQVRTGSTVIDVAYEIYPDDFVFLGGHALPRPRGHAATVDLGSRGLLILTFRDAERTPAQRKQLNAEASWCTLTDISCLPFIAYRVPEDYPYSEEKAALYTLLKEHGPRDVPFIALPYAVRLANRDDRNGFVPLSPFDLASSFGPGIALRRVTLELTDDAVSPPPAAWPEWMKTAWNGDFN